MDELFNTVIAITREVNSKVNNAAYAGYQGEELAFYAKTLYSTVTFILIDPTLSDSEKIEKLCIFQNEMVEELREKQLATFEYYTEKYMNS